MKTLTGIDIGSIANKMIEPLDKRAFKKHPTKSYLTTIDPAWTRERLTEVFGLAGYGWGLTWNPEHTERFMTQTSKGKDWYHFMITYADFWYVLIDGDQTHRFVIPTTGHSDNDSIGDAMAGARTSCLSTAVKELLFQLHIYKDMQPEPPKKDTRGTTSPTAQAERNPRNKPNGEVTKAMLKDLWVALKANYEDDEAEEIGRQLINKVTNGRTDSSKELTVKEYHELMAELEPASK